MIKDKTVFIFGAGLSSDYDFPTGSKLRDEIVRHIMWDNRSPSLPSQIKRLIKMGFNEDTINLTRDAIRRGNFNTIDEFMEVRPELRPLTKALIVSIISQYEKPDISLEKDDTTCFYRFIFAKMMKQATLDTFADNNVSFITFNYDRSFEFFIWRTLKQRFSLNENDKRLSEIMNRIKVVHVHGKLGKLPWEIGGGEVYRYYRPITGDEDINNLKSICNNIISFVEVTDSHTKYAEAREEIKNAENLFFVGFGFHETNTRRLLDDISFENKKIVLGTAYKKDDLDLKEINKFTNAKLHSGNLCNINAVQFANQYLKGRI